MMDLTPIAISVISLLTVVASAYFLPWLKVKLGNEKMAKLNSMVQIAVSAAEQMANAGFIKKEEKKKHVLDFLEKNGLTADLNLIEEMIEAAVNDLK